MSASYLTNFSRQRFRRRIASALWQALPALTIGLFLVPSGIPRGATALVEVLPPLALLVMFYWSVERPGKVGYPLVFIAGIIQDTLLSTPFGLSALLWMLFRLVVAWRHKDVSGQGFVVNWVFCSGLLLVTLVLQWGIVGQAYKVVLPLWPVLLQVAMGVFCYPAIHALMHRIEKLFHRRYWYVLKAS